MIVHRYGRVLAHAAIQQATIKFNLQIERKCQDFSNFLGQYDEDLSEYENTNPRDIRNTRDLNDAREKLRFSCDKTKDMCDLAKRNQPERRVYEVAVNNLQNQGVSIHNS